MYKFITDNVIVFDAEWVPDPDSGRRTYDLPSEMSDEEVIEHMYEQGGATPEDPQPYLKTILCRVVSVAAVMRRKKGTGKPELVLHSLPTIGNGVMEEKTIISRFLDGVGKRKAQIVGYNSTNSDIPILLQRGLACGVSAPRFCQRPARPWEGIDYFARYGDYSIDLKDIISGYYGKAIPSLHELATVLGIPGKLETSGLDVQELWAKGDIESIVMYNQYDALTTYLVWLRSVYFSGKLNYDDYRKEERALENLLIEHIDKGDSHLQAYLDKWRTLRENRESTTGGN